MAQNTLRAALEANMAASDNGTLGKPQDAPEIITDAPEPAEVSAAPSNTETAQEKADRIRDEQGRFAAKEKAQEATKTPAPEVEKASEVQADSNTEKPAVVRPTTWKKDYLPIYDKLVSGGENGAVTLTPDEANKFAQYMMQREREYATGVSTYKSEAQQAKHLSEAIAPFVQDLQRNNINPAQWITNLGNAHKALAMGSPEQKLAMFSKLASDYGVPIHAVSAAQSGSLDPVVPQLMQQIQALQEQVSNVANWRNMQEQQTTQQQISKFMDAEKYPYFEQVREHMAQLLESGLAPDLDSAYAKAVRLNDETWSAEQERQSQAIAQQTLQKRQAEEKALAAQRAKAANVSVKTTTPSGVTNVEQPKDRRSALAAGFAALEGGRV